MIKYLTSDIYNLELSLSILWQARKIILNIAIQGVKHKMLDSLFKIANSKSCKE